MSYYTDNRTELETLAPILRRIATGEATEEEKQQERRANQVELPRQEEILF